LKKVSGTFQTLQKLEAFPVSGRLQTPFSTGCYLTMEEWTLASAGVDRRIFRIFC
jgi:hypothetical protein